MRKPTLQEVKRLVLRLCKKNDAGGAGIVESIVFQLCTTVLSPLPGSHLRHGVGHVKKMGDSDDACDNSS